MIRISIGTLFCMIVVMTSGLRERPRDWIERELPTSEKTTARQKAAPAELISAVQIELRPHEEQPHAGLARPHPHGDQICASGCTLTRHPTKLLTPARFDTLIEQLADSETHDDAVDRLLYYGPQTQRRLNTLNKTRIRNADLELLTEELSHAQCSISIRLRAEDGRELADLPPQIVPFDLRHEYQLTVNGIPSLAASGTVKRVGRYEFWSRL